MPCLDIVLRYASTFSIQHAEVVLREGIALLGKWSPLT
jgi:hypothetical protein